MRFVAVGALLLFVASATQGSQARPRTQTIALQVLNEADGRTFLEMSSVGRPFTFDAQSLHFSWQADGLYAKANVPMTPAKLTVGAWAPVTVYPSYINTAPDRLLVRKYRASLALGGPPGPPGRYQLSVSAPDGFARTDQGTTIDFGESNSQNVAEVYWPDERNGDAAAAGLRRRIEGRTLYAFGGSVVGCYGSGRGYPPTTPLRVTAVFRHRGVTYGLGTGATVHGGGNGDYFFAIDPIEVKISVAGAPFMTSGSSNSETPCDPGFRFADPWQSDVTLTSEAPPPDLLGMKIVPGTTRRVVLWLLGYPDYYGTAEYFNAMDEWDYQMPAPFSSSVTFAHDRVVQYHPPGRLP